MRGRVAVATLCAGLSSWACKKAETAPLYEKFPVQRRNIVVTATAVGVIKPSLTFSVKSKAWGQILEMPVQTGDEVKKGQLLARIDPRIQRDNLTTAQAALARAQAQLTNATAQYQRATALFKSQSIAETDFDAAKLAAATAQAAVVKARANLQTAQDAMEDTHVKAPITGTILQIQAVLGTVISSPTLGGGTVILTMANLDTVQDSALVLETDVGRIDSGMPVTSTVDAYPNRPFEGSVYKIEPQAQIVQNSTMFPVLTNVPNPGHLLRPGMNTRVQVHTGERTGVLAIPNAALRTQRDMAAAATILGLDPGNVQRQLAAPPPSSNAPAQVGGGDTARSSQGGGATGGQTITTPSGRTITLPPGVNADQVRGIFAKMANGGDLSADERALLTQLRGSRAGGGGQGGGGGGGAGTGGRGQNRRGIGTSYVVFVERGGQPTPVAIRTGLTDQDFVEVTSGLSDHDTVLVLPSASLVQSQQQFKQRFQNVTGGGLPGLRQQGAQGAAGAPGAAPAQAPRRAPAGP
ncbi:MAG TPA: efflux RND transporter periplasmic adaptor subunit [Gemmatimonadales bacterium]|nr:efflux RND transporter periplasmic adaptor subunit [Gemmatimonadales bacterium]